MKRKTGAAPLPSQKKPPSHIAPHRLIAAAAILIAAGCLAWLAYSFFTTDIYVDTLAAESGSKQLATNALSALAKAKDPARADLILRRLPPKFPPEPRGTAWSEAAASRTILPPGRIYGMTVGATVFAVAADPLGILHNTKITRQAEAEAPATWNSLWTFAAKRRGADSPPLAIAGADPLALTQVLMVLTEALSDAQTAREGLSRLWADPAAGI
ncbi:MAG: hypothetical protein Q8M76_15970, partial [Spirochaetaceae bacterium]|nr:hypothetical protein [Spirochaetaceae bacterium]